MMILKQCKNLPTFNYITKSQGGQHKTQVVINGNKINTDSGVYRSGWTFDIEWDGDTEGRAYIPDELRKDLAPNMYGAWNAYKIAEIPLGFSEQEVESCINVYGELYTPVGNITVNKQNLTADKCFPNVSGFYAVKEFYELFQTDIPYAFIVDDSLVLFASLVSIDIESGLYLLKLVDEAEGFTGHISKISIKESPVKQVLVPISNEMLPQDILRTHYKDQRENVQIRLGNDMEETHDVLLTFNYDKFRVENQGAEAGMEVSLNPHRDDETICIWSGQHEITYTPARNDISIRDSGTYVMRLRGDTNEIVLRDHADKRTLYKIYVENGELKTAKTE